MPLGNHTSQFFANIYLNDFDRFIKHSLKAKYYIRYVDDFVIFSNSKEELQQWKEQIDQFLRKNLNLELHPDKSQIVSLNQGVTFLGFKIFYYNMLIRKSNLRNFERKFKGLKILYKEEQLNREKVVEHLEGWLEYARHANTYKYRKELLKNFNKHFSIKHKGQIIRSKKIRNFFRKVYASKLEFSTQKTLLLIRKGLNTQQISQARSIKEGTVWGHYAKLIEHGQLSVWGIIPRMKILKIMPKIKNPVEPLKQIKERIKDKNISFDEINCVRSYLKMKEEIKSKVY